MDHLQNQYQFCYNSDDAYSLTITKHPSHIYDHLYQQGNYVWLVQDGTVLKSRPEQIQSMTKLKINFVKSMEDFKLLYQESSNIILIAPISLKDSIEPLFVPFKILSIVFYGVKKGSTKALQFKSININFSGTEQQAIQQIISNKKFHTTANFINFISLDKQKWDSNILVRTMFAMIKQKTNVSQVMQQFKQLAMICFDQFYQQDIEEFVQQYSKAQHMKKYRAVQWYTRQTFLYKFVNSMLRISKDPTCLYIIQPYFQDLFHNIKKLYKQQQQKNNCKEFTCYRGAQISENQIKFFQQNKGSFIQNLGFLSTSRNKVMGRKFVKNVLFIISVEDKLRKKQLDYGFADLTGINKLDEDQILFNPLNNFKITDFQYYEEGSFYIITLLYGEMSRITVCDDKTLTENELNYKWFGQHQIRENKNCKYLSHVLIENGYNLQGGSQYCNKFLEIAINNKNQDTIYYGYFLKAKIAGNKGDYKNMEIMSNKYLEMLDKRQQNRNEDQKQIYLKIVPILQNLGMCFHNLCQNQKAVKYYQRCEQIQKQILGENHPGYATTLNNLGLCFYQLGDYHKSVDYFQKCLKIQKQMLGENNPDYAITLNNLGLCFYQLGESEKSVRYYQRCEKIQQQILGENHPHYALTLNSLGKAFNRLGQYQRAMKYYERSQKIQRKILGQNNPYYAITLNNLGLCCTNLIQYQKAFKYFQRCQKIQKQIVGENHPEYALTLNNLALLFDSMGQFEKAIEYLRRCQKIQRQMLGKNHPSYVTTLSNLGLCCLRLNQHEKALEFFQRCVQIQKLNLGQNHPDYAITLNNLGLSLNNLGQYQKAIGYYERCEKIQRQILGQNHPFYATTLNNLGSCCINLVQYEKAMKYFQRCQKIRKYIFGENHPDYAQTMSNLALLFDSLGQYEKAVEYNERCQKILRQILGENHRFYGKILNCLSKAYSKTGETEKSQYYSKKYSEFQKNFTKNMENKKNQNKQFLQIKNKQRNQFEMNSIQYLYDYKQFTEKVPLVYQQKKVKQRENFWLTIKLM